MIQAHTHTNRHTRSTPGLLLLQHVQTDNTTCLLTCTTEAVATPQHVVNHTPSPPHHTLVCLSATCLPAQTAQQQLWAGTNTTGLDTPTRCAAAPHKTDQPAVCGPRGVHAPSWFLVGAAGLCDLDRQQQGHKAMAGKSSTGRRHIQLQRSSHRQAVQCCDSLSWPLQVHYPTC